MWTIGYPQRMRLMKQLFISFSLPSSIYGPVGIAVQLSLFYIQMSTRSNCTHTDAIKNRTLNVTEDQIRYLQRVMFMLRSLKSSSQYLILCR